MPPPTRQRIEPTDDWQPLELLTREPAQRTYELIRPVVLFGRTPAERARETGAVSRAAGRTPRRRPDCSPDGASPAPTRAPRMVTDDADLDRIGDVPVYEWRVTKYDPRLRDGSGAFRGDDWTSASDIGGSFGGARLDLAAYLRVEDAYVAAAMRFLAEAGLSSLEVVGLETTPPLPLSGDLARLLTDGPPVAGHQHLAGGALERACRLNLRSLLWCRLERSGVFFLHFGHDYYMYVGSVAPCPASVRQAREIGLFVEAMPSPYRAV